MSVDFWEEWVGWLKMEGRAKLEDSAEIEKYELKAVPFFCGFYFFYFLFFLFFKEKYSLFQAYRNFQSVAVLHLCICLSRVPGC